MKKWLLIFVFALMAGFVNAQVSLGFHANGILANVNSSSLNSGNGNYEKEDTKSLLSWKVGAFASFPLSERLSFMPQLNLLSKGAKVDANKTFTDGTTSTDINIKGSLKLTYLELPLFITMSEPEGKNGLYVGIGPVLSYGLSGKSVVTGTTNTGISDTQSQDVKFDGKKDANDDNYHLKSLEFGVGAFAGYKLDNGLFFNLHFNYGFSNIDPSSDGKLKTIYAGLGIGYFFNHSK